MFTKVLFEIKTFIFYFFIVDVQCTEFTHNNYSAKLLVDFKMCIEADPLKTVIIKIVNFVV